MKLFLHILITLALFFFTFGQLGRISIPGQPVYFYLYEAFVYLSLLVLIITYGFAPLNVKKPLIKAISIFFVWLAVSLFISFFYYTTDQNIVAFLYLLRLGVYFLFLIYFNTYCHSFPQVKKYVHLVVCIMAMGVIASSLVQYFLYQNFGNISYLGWDPHQYRLVGLFFDPPLTVSVLGLFLLYFFLQAKGKYRIFYWIVSATFLVLTFLTYSRGGYLALMVTAGLYSLRRVKMVRVGVASVCLIAIFLAIPKGDNESINLLRTTSIETRAQDYSIALQIWQKAPITGIGYNHIRYEKDLYLDVPIEEKFNPSHASASFHSSFLMILVTGGVVGLAGFIWLLYTIAQIGEFAKYSLIFLSVISLTDNVLLHPFLLFLFFILLPVNTLIHLSDTSQ